MNVTIIGIGLIGGSIALHLKASGKAKKITGVDRNENHLKEALQLGIIDESAPLENALEKTDLVIIAIPVNAARELTPKILDQIGENTVVMDMGSTKAGICAQIQNHPKRKNFVATHPIAGTENTGPKAAFNGLFTNKVSIICDRDKSAEQAIRVVEDLYNSIPMRLIYMDAEEHDMHIAYVSHLSHISSFTLGLTVLDMEKNEKNIFNMAGSGFASTVRLAKSSPDMWAPIFEQNTSNVSTALGIYIEKLKLFKQYIDQKNIEKIRELMIEANQIRRILDGIELAVKA